MKLRRRSGFTLIELLVVIAIIAILVALLLPAVQQAREAARRSTCKNQLKQLGIAVHNYHDTYSVFPMASIHTVGPGGQRHSGFVGLLPFIEQGPLFDLIAGGGTAAAVNGTTNYFENSFVPWDNNHVAVGTQIPSLLCPSDSPVQNEFRAQTNYMFSRGDSAWDHNPQWNGNQELRGFFVGGSNNSGVRRFRDITDGTSNTVCMAERIIAKNNGNSRQAGQSANANQGDYRDNPAHCLGLVNGDGTYNVSTRSEAGRRWIDGLSVFTGVTTIVGPNKASCSQGENDGVMDPSSQHRGGAQVLMGDGAVRFISENINTGNLSANAPRTALQPSPYGVWGALGSVNGGEPIGEF